MGTKDHKISFVKKSIFQLFVPPFRKIRKTKEWKINTVGQGAIYNKKLALRSRASGEKKTNFPATLRLFAPFSGQSVFRTFLFIPWQKHFFFAVARWSNWIWTWLWPRKMCKWGEEEDAGRELYRNLLSERWDTLAQSWKGFMDYGFSIVFHVEVGGEGKNEIEHTSRMFFWGWEKLLAFCVMGGVWKNRPNRHGQPEISLRDSWTVNDSPPFSL